MGDLELLYQSIPEIGTLYRSKQLSPLELTKLCLKRIEELDPVLNAFITVTAEKALLEAKQAEQELRSGHDRGLLHGIPIALKDLIDTAGIRTTCASRILKDHVASRDAQLVQRLEAAGAISLGKTNLSEFAMGIAHPDYGPTHNPWNPSHTSGASSGGSAAAVAAGMCFAAVGTDTGGSIRIPASYCGLAGLKPTYGLVNLEGVFPLAWSLDHAGPLARSSGDAGLLLQAMTGKSQLWPAQLSGMHFGVIQRGGKGIKPEVTAQFDAACAVLLAAGAKVEEVQVPDLGQADTALFGVLLPEVSALHARWINNQPEDYAPLTRTQIEMGFAIPAVTYVRAQQFRRYLTRQFLSVLDKVDALLSPTVPWTAPQEDPVFTGDEGTLEGHRTVPHNLTGLPALSVNVGFANNLPVGMQIITKPHTDAFCLGIGLALEGLLPQAQLHPGNP